MVAGLGAIALGRGIAPGGSLGLAMTACAAIALVVIVGERLLAQEPRARPPARKAAEASADSPGHALVRALGLAVTLGIVALAYWLFPEYHGDFYAPFWQFLQWLFPVVAIGAVPYFWIASRRHGGPDAYLVLGRLLLGRGWARIDRDLLRAHFLGWAVKAFFLPLMVVYLRNQVDSVVNGWPADFAWNIPTYRFCFDCSFLVDLLFCVVGYTLTLRMLDTHIRSTEPTPLGWIVALVCYQPFFSVIGNYYLRYESGTIWDGWLASSPLLLAAWGTLILVLVWIYALATVAFGLRFSNLTHRGIITSGPYALVKHPAYLSKNLSWWMISVPFVATAGWAEALRHCLLLALLNGVYALRAWTEERHLRRDPAYVAYCQWIREHGLVARLAHATGLRR